MAVVEKASPQTSLPTITLAASLGTTVEWYDFFIYALLAVFLATTFFPSQNPAAGILLSVGALGSGYVFRPLGGLIFGTMGDRVGRKKTFVITMMLMGIATVCIGILPTYAQVGISAPILLASLRLVQGLALGGEYGGAATYIAECAPPGRVGFWTSWIQTTASLGLILATGTILATKSLTSSQDFAAWGWRAPFLLSAILIRVSTWIRLRMYETPVFVQMQREGTLAKSPLKSALGNISNLKLILITLFGISIGAAAINGVAFLFTPIFLQAVLKIEANTAITATMIGVILAAPACVLFGALYDRYGGSRLIFWGLVLNGLAMIPLFLIFKSVAEAPALVPLTIVIFVQLFLFAVVQGPYAAFMTEVFPPQVRYTSISLPFNIANSFIGGMLPLISLGLITATSNQHVGLAYPVAVIAITVVVNLIWLQGKVLRPQTRSMSPPLVN